MGSATSANNETSLITQPCHTMKQFLDYQRAQYNQLCGNYTINTVYTDIGAATYTDCITQVCNGVLWATVTETLRFLDIYCVKEMSGLVLRKDAGDLCDDLLSCSFQYHMSDDHLIWL